MVCEHLERNAERGVILVVAGVTPKWVGAFLCWDVGIFECVEIEASPQVSILPTTTRTSLDSFFFFALNAVIMFSSVEGGWVGQDTILFRDWDVQAFHNCFFSDHRHDPRSGVVFHSFVVLVSLLLVSGHGQRSVTHFECEDGAAGRHLAGDCGRASQLERRGGVGHKGAVLFFDVALDSC